MGILTEDLALPEDPDDLEATYRGLCRAPREGSKRRRIDFLAVPWQCRGAALLYYTVRVQTVSIMHNTSFLVSRRGMILCVSSFHIVAQQKYMVILLVQSRNPDEGECDGLFAQSEGVIWGSSSRPPRPARKAQYGYGFLSRNRFSAYC